MNKIKSPKKKLSKSALVLIIACIIIAIPVVTFGSILLIATLKTGTPILGERFKNDLDPAITSSDQSAIEDEINALGNVDSCEIILTSAQLRVNIDASDSISSDDAKTLAEKAYDIVDKNLDVDTYFTMSSDGKKMYDLAINVYNYIPDSNDDSSWISYLLTKNSKMDEKEGQLISNPIAPDLAKELINGGTTTTDADSEQPETSE